MAKAASSSSKSPSSPKISTQNKPSRIVSSHSKISIEELDEIFGAPPLIEGEELKNYEALEHSLRSAINPSDILEELWFRDMVDAQWEILRFKKMKVSILDMSKLRALKALKQERYGIYESQKDIGAQTYSEALEIMGYPESALLAMNYSINLEKLTTIENNIFKLERRRNETLGALENYRSIKSKRKSLIVDLDVQSPGGKK
jgi:hypothetical protein